MEGIASECLQRPGPQVGFAVMLYVWQFSHLWLVEQAFRERVTRSRQNWA